jgi:hypothetical protein
MSKTICWHYCRLFNTGPIDHDVSIFSRLSKYCGRVCEIRWTVGHFR